MVAEELMDDFESAKDYMRIYAEDPREDTGYSWMAPIDGGYVGVTRTGGIAYVDWRGSTTPKDWLWNFEAKPIRDGSLGMVHEGFAKGVWKVQDALVKELGAERCAVRGHSRGAAQAAIFAGHLTAIGLAPANVVLWGCPRPGFAALAQVLAPVQISSYRNLSDPVTEVPFNIDLPGHNLDIPYVHVREFIQLEAKPSPLDLWGPLAPHHMALYVKGLSEIGSH